MPLSSDRKLNIFIIRSPFSYVNSLEFRYFFKLDPETCFLLVGYAEQESIDVQHIRRLYDEKQWAGVAFFPQSLAITFKEGDEGQLRGVPTVFLKVLRLGSYAKRLSAVLPSGEVARVILQNIDDYAIVHLANTLQPAEVYCLDEGPKSLYTNSLRKQKKGILRQGGCVDTVKRLLMQVLSGYRVCQLTNVTYFSCYDLKTDHGEKLIRHSYEFMRSQVLRLPRDNDLVLFIGQPFSEVGVFDEAFNLESLAIIREHFSTKKMVYVAHRGDSEAKLKKIEKQLAIPVVLYDMPFELQIAMLGPVPSALVSFYSSVLVNCHEMFQSTLPVISYRIPLERIEPERRESIKLVYKYFDEYRSDSFFVEDINGQPSRVI
jgi:Alpha-2,8-polysialyltransferase (POLYST)